MATRRQGHRDEVMLIPFLDILCSLIGVLIIIIVMVCVAQLQKAKGRTREELALAARHQQLLREQREQEQADARRAADLAELETKSADLKEKQARLEELRRQLSITADAASANRDQAARLQKEIESLLAEIEAIARGLPAVRKEIEELKKLLAERQKKASEKPPSVVVRPSGSGVSAGRRLFFVEASGAAIAIRKAPGETVRVLKDGIGVDEGFNAFLQEVKNTKGSSLVFLVRRDGWWTYQKAAGWAEQGYGILAGKLPIPGDGPVDLGLFEKR